MLSYVSNLAVHTILTILKGIIAGTNIWVKFRPCATLQNETTATVTVLVSRAIAWIRINFSLEIIKLYVIQQIFFYSLVDIFFLSFC